jgi:hypothetical protein
LESENPAFAQAATKLNIQNSQALPKSAKIRGMPSAYWEI